MRWTGRRGPGPGGPAPLRHAVPAEYPVALGPPQEVINRARPPSRRAAQHRIVRARGDHTLRSLRRTLWHASCCPAHRLIDIRPLRASTPAIADFSVKEARPCPVLGPACMGPTAGGGVWHHAARAPASTRSNEASAGRDSESSRPTSPARPARPAGIPGTAAHQASRASENRAAPAPRYCRRRVPSMAVHVSLRHARRRRTDDEWVPARCIGPVDVPAITAIIPCRSRRSCGSFTAASSNGGQVSRCTYEPWGATPLQD